MEHLTTRLHAQFPAASSGIPKLSGYWDAGLIYGVPGGPRPPRVERSLLKLINSRAKAVIAAFDEYASPKYDCVGGAVPHILVDLFKLRVEQRDDRVIFSYEKDDVVRTVWLEGHRHPAPKAGEYFQEGYSTGRYEGGKLIVVTAKFTYDPMGKYRCHRPARWT